MEEELHSTLAALSLFVDGNYIHYKCIPVERVLRDGVKDAYHFHIYTRTEPQVP
jgi:hypothetical protein